MPKTTELNAAELAVGKKNGKIKTGSIGSCVVIVIFDDTNKIGGMAHAMLPARKDKKNNLVTEAPAKYANEAVDNLIREIKKIGGQLKNFKAKLVGGARMFKILSGDNFGIGYKNVQSAKKRLEELNIPLDGEDTGGSSGKIAELDLFSGLLEVNTRI